MTTTTTDHSGTTTANTSIEAAPAATERHSIDFQNVSDTEMFVDFGKSASATAGAGSFKVAAGGFQRWNNPAYPDSIHVFCTASGKGFVLKTT